MKNHWIMMGWLTNFIEKNKFSWERRRMIQMQILQEGHSVPTEPVLREHLQEGRSEPPRPFQVNSAKLANFIAAYYEDNKVRRNT